ncbi:MAG: PriCT-2 domain-containing protein [Pseudomonas sp.]|uniref:PriCT-2 domain-containing protein n=1 Tax=Pseudomonas sp. TaxID=306 RepID=UPI003BB7C165
MSDRVPLTVADLQELLSYIPADNRETWVAVAMGVKSEFGEAGFDDWLTWSKNDKSFDAAAAKSVWKSCRKGGSGAGRLINLAKASGWAPRREPMTAEEKRRLNAEAEARRVVRQAEIEADEQKHAAMREAVAAACQLIWDKHCKPTGSSAYLARKGVQGFGIGFFDYTVVLSIDDARLRCDVWAGSEVKAFFNNLPKPRPDSSSFLMFKPGAIAVPLRDAAGKLWSLQAINEQGTKLFPKYGRKSGCFHLIAGEATDVLGIAEGYATAASVHMATCLDLPLGMGKTPSWPVAVAIDSGNLLPVARAMRELNPDVSIYLAADDDPTVKGNPGRAKAEAAALAIDGVAVFPIIPGEPA